ncbi:hypothetical protein J2Z35_002704 [Acetoanaerobium pronyense]|uniref:Uncharacterized protein n=1 Tax=Acetoanaerobium pronyense TaxID=1482736 RepID=A0ABS4KNS3_9FIRM|nr:hypothetical protein [Acetoanaerobium pronyense]MBP2028866.1 hypothetical protein [Acetoanaerobium pronyense]
MGRASKSIKSAKPTKPDKTDCFAYQPTKCVALTKNNCNGCTFYKTASALKADREKAMTRIITLDIEIQDKIARDYFGGGKDGSL